MTSLNYLCKDHISSHILEVLEVRASTGEFGEGTTRPIIAMYQEHLFSSSGF